MNFNQHSNLQNQHAFLSASQSAWVNYSPEKLVQVYENNQKKIIGTIHHEFASIAIKQRIKLAPLKKAINMFVNDAIGYNMESEVVLKYSNNAFGTADAISFKDGLLRIHDLKTGVNPVKFRQLDVYTAFFCLEYDVDPFKINVEQRIYQGREIMINEPSPEDIKTLMEIIIEFDKIIEGVKINL